MNANQLINMILKIFLRKAVNGGINAGMRKMSGGKGAGSSGAPMDATQGKQAVRKARQAARAARRMGKM
ncbi:MAG: hypothetical protein ACU0A4_13550 [Paracoccaceae bacterium]